MDEAVIKFYRKLLRSGFEHSGSLENALIFLDSVGEKVLICGSTGDFMQLYINVVNDRIDNIRYMCVCDPTANVAVEILCTLMKGKTLDEAAVLNRTSVFSISRKRWRRTTKKKLKACWNYLVRESYDIKVQT